MFRDSVMPSRRPVIDVRQAVNGFLLMIPSAVVALGVSWFSQSSQVRANTTEIARHESTLKELRAADRERDEKDGARAIAQAETNEKTIGRVEAIVSRLDDIVRRLERLEAK